jgi:hypothetical protein
MKRPLQIVVLSLVWAALLFGADRLATPPTAAAGEGVVALRFAHLCRSSCVEAATAAVLGLDAPGLGDPQRNDDTLSFPVTDARRLDFVAILDALAHAGLAPSSLRYRASGALRAELAHPPEDSCVEDAEQRVRDFVQRTRSESRGARYAWLGEVRFEHGEARIAVTGEVEILDVVAAIAAAGMTPRSLEP